MNRNIQLSRCFWSCLSAALVLSAPSQAIAQNPPVQNTAGTRRLAPLRLTAPYLPTPDLPLPRAILPEAETLRLVIRLSQRRVYVYRNDTLQMSYPIAVGRPGWETPTGAFQVISMIRNPGWTNPFTREVVPPGSDNPLGERWIGFWTDGRNYIGFHGTPNEESVGRAASHGCIRMLNQNVRTLYDMVALGTPVTVEP